MSLNLLTYSATTFISSSPCNGFSIMTSSLQLSEPEKPSVEMMQMEPQELSDALQDSETCSRILLLDLRSFLAYNQNHIVHSHNVNIPGVVFKRYLKNKESFVRQNVASMFSTENGKYAFQNRSGKRVVIIDERGLNSGEVHPSDMLMDTLRVDTSIQSVSGLKGGFEAFAKLFPHLCVSNEHVAQSLSISTDVVSRNSVLDQDSTSYRNLPPSQVFPWLWMGSDEDAANIDLLNRLGIRFIVNVARECNNHHHNSFLYKNIAAEDNIESPQEFESEVLEACRFIANSKKSGAGNVFVHCRSGVSRSATIVIAYLLHEEGWSFDNAIDHVRMARPCVSPNLGFLCLLIEMEKQINRKKESPLATSSPSNSKENRADSLYISTTSMSTATTAVCTPTTSTISPTTALTTTGGRNSVSSLSLAIPHYLVSTPRTSSHVGTPIHDFSSPVTPCDPNQITQSPSVKRSSVSRLGSLLSFQALEDESNTRKANTPTSDDHLNSNYSNVITTSSP